MREMLGNMLLELGRPAEALEAYEASMHAAPNRLRGLYGAAKATQASGDEVKARRYFEKLAALGSHADPTRPEIHEAKEYLLAKN
jgi:tetratricopeptide (TPR) repeat protein